MTSLSLFLWICAGILFQVAIFLGIGFWRIPVFAAAFAFQVPTLSHGMVALGIGVGMLFLFEITKKALSNSQPRQAIE